MLPYLLIALSTLASEDLACIGTGLLVSQHRLGFVAGTAACAFGIFAGDLLLVLAGRSARFGRLRARAAFLAACGRSTWTSGSQAKQPAPPSWLNELWASVGQAFSLPDFCHRLLGGNTRWKLAATRFTPGLRLPIYVAAGLSRIPMRLVIPPLLIGAAVWTPLLVGAAEWFGGVLVVRGLKALEIVLIAIVLVKLAIRYRIFSYEKRRIALAFIHRIFRWEFWPAWAAYTPLVPYILWLAVRHRSLTLFTAANPGIPTGGLVGESKASILQHLRREPDLLARWTLLPGDVGADERVNILRSFMNREDLTFPIVLKPDLGERGSGVSIIRSESEALAYLETDRDVIAQEYIAGPEFGVFYRRYPGEGTGQVVSITAKIMPEVTGDGSRTLKHLILADSRAFCLHQAYLSVSKHDPSYVPAGGERVRLVEIGSHCRGAIFLDATKLCTPALERAIDRISRSHPGFFYGRFDVRAQSVDAFQQGRFRVLELNGVGSEPTHVYDPSISIWKKYRVLANHWREMFDIGAATQARGIQPASVGELWRTCRNRGGRRALVTRPYSLRRESL
jgi:membrane protein DedA with SNARE-associated domain